MWQEWVLLSRQKRGIHPTKLSGSGLVLEQEQVKKQTAPINSCRLRCACHGAFTHPDDFPGRPQRHQNLAFFGYCAPQGEKRRCNRSETVPG